MGTKTNEHGEVVDEGYYGNCTPSQEEALKKAWSILFDIWARNPERSDELTRQGGAKVAQSGNELSDVTAAKEKEAKQKDSGTNVPVVDNAVQKYGGKYLHDEFWRTVMMDPPDQFVLRFLRAREFDVHRAVEMLIAALQFRIDINLDELLRRGEAGLQDEKGFLDQFKRGVSYIHGCTNKSELPIYFVHVGRHYTSAQRIETLQKFIVLSMENARMLCTPPMEKAIIVFDLRGFGLKNADWQAITFILKCLEAYYPESLSRIYIHSAPWIFKGIWAALQPLLNERVQSKIKFSSSAKDLGEFISADHLPADMGGTLDWTWEYTPPRPGENDIQNDEQTRRAIEEEWRALHEAFDDATKHWIEGDDEVTSRRTVLTKQLRLKYYQLAPYIRAMNVYQRTGVIQSDFQIHWSHSQKGGGDALQKMNMRQCAPALIQWLREKGEDTLEDSVGGTQSPCAKFLGANEKSDEGENVAESEADDNAGADHQSDSTELESEPDANAMASKHVSADPDHDDMHEDQSGAHGLREGMQGMSMDESNDGGAVPQQSETTPAKSDAPPSKGMGQKIMSTIGAGAGSAAAGAIAVGAAAGSAATNAARSAMSPWGAGRDAAGAGNDDDRNNDDDYDGYDHDDADDDYDNTEDESVADFADAGREFDMDDEERSIWNEDRALDTSETTLAPSYTDVKVHRKMCMQTDAELRADLEKAHEVMELFLNSQMREAESLCMDGADRRLYLAAGMSLINSVKSLMTFEPDDMQVATKCCKHTMSIARVLRRPKSKLSKLVPGKASSVPLARMTLVEQHAEVVYAEALLCKTIVGIVYAGDTIGLIREAMGLRTAYACLRNLLKMIEAADEAAEAANRQGEPSHKTMDQDLRSGVYFGMGCCMLVLSLLEPRMLKFMEGVGYDGNRAKAMSLFERAGGWTHTQDMPNVPASHEGLRRPMCDLAILVYHLSLPSIVPVPDVDLVFADHVLSYNLQRFPRGIFFLFFSALLYATQALPDKAINCFRIATEAQHEYKQLDHLCNWRLSLTYLSTGEYDKAYECFDLLALESNWSKVIYQYAKAAIIFESDPTKHATADTIMHTIPGLVRKMAGRHLPFERFVTKKAEAFHVAAPTGLPAMEFAYLWHCLAQTPVFLLVETHLAKINAVLTELDKYESPASFPGGTSAFYGQFCLAHFLRGVALRYAAFPKKYTVVQKPLHENIDVAQMATDAARSLRIACTDGQHCDAVDRYIVYFAHYELGSLYAAQGDLAKARYEFELIQSRRPLVPQDSRLFKSGKAAYLLSHVCQMRASVAMSTMQLMQNAPPVGPPRGPPRGSPRGLALRPKADGPPPAKPGTPSAPTSHMHVAPATHYNDIPDTLTRSSTRSRDIGRRARHSRLFS